MDCRSAFSTVEKQDRKQEETESLWMFGDVIMLPWLIPTFLEKQPEELKEIEVGFHLFADKADNSNGCKLGNHCLTESLQSDICRVHALLSNLHMLLLPCEHLLVCWWVCDAGG